MNIELDEVVVQDVSDDALEMASGGARGGAGELSATTYPHSGWADCSWSGPCRG